jgi:2',3'-cyclic-nucleotide 2'-phosphodiesterase/3'-nucleotidase
VSTHHRTNRWTWWTRAVLFPLLLLWASCGRRPAHRVTLTLLSTTDLHGHLAAWDDLRNRPANWGLVKVATVVRHVRATHPNVLLLDCGDLIEGSPLAYFYARRQPEGENPVIAAMNALQYDAVALGNHDFNFGLETLWRAHQQAHFAWLAANLEQDYASGPGHFDAYTIKTIGGVRVGIIGFVTPAIPHWELPEHYRGYRFRPIVEAARAIVPEVRRQADLVVAILHSGLDRDPATGRTFPVLYPEENVAWEVAEQVPGIDVLFFGHTHRELGEKFVNGVLLAQARYWGQSVAEADVELEQAADGRWHVTRKRSHLLPIDRNVAPDADLEALIAPYRKPVETYLDTPLAHLDRPLEGSAGRVDDTALVDLIHRVQLDSGHADVSLATMFLPTTVFPAGTVTVRQIFALYPYENWLYTVELTGEQLRQALEHAASFFPSWPPGPQGLRLPSYSADSAEGVSYELDLSRPVGQRIRNLRYRGGPLDPRTTLRVAVNNYRYSGGGGYRMLDGQPIVYRSSEEVRELIVDWLAQTHRMIQQPDGNWRVVPEAARRALLREAEHPPRGSAAPEAAVRWLDHLLLPARFARLPAVR